MNCAHYIKRIAVPGIALMLMTFTAVAGAAEIDNVMFRPLHDRAGEEIGFKALINSPDGQPYEIRRVVVETPYYDGLPGFNALMVRRYFKHSVNGPHEVLTTLFRGTLHLIGFDFSTDRTLALEYRQVGHYLRITGLMIFGSATPEGKRLGKRGSFQFASLAPDGKYCVLVDKGLRIINLKDGSDMKIELNPPLSGNEADPARVTPSGYNVGGSADLSGKYMNIIWQTPQAGKLIIRDKQGQILREIKIDTGRSI